MRLIAWMGAYKAFEVMERPGTSTTIGKQLHSNLPTTSCQRIGRTWVQFKKAIRTVRPTL